MRVLHRNPEDIAALLRPNIRALKPYSSARDEFRPAGETASPGVDNLIFLDANENSLGGPLDGDFSRYPDPHQRALKQRIARREGLEPEQVFVGNGSDEAIDLLIRAFCNPGTDNVVQLPPTYGMYAVQAGIQGVEIRSAPLRPDFSPDPEAVLAAMDAQSKILFLCSPNNPSGNCLPGDYIREMLFSFPGLVVVDEAYGDFSGQPSLTGWLPEFPNLVVLKTFSKAWGMAGLRVGMALSSAFIVRVLDQIKYPYNMNAVTVQLVETAIQREAGVHEKVNRLLEERRRLAEALALLPCVTQVFPSAANFLLVRTVHADNIYQFLLQRGIVVRNRSRELHCHNCLRITVGTAAENDRLLEALQVVGPAPASQVPPIETP